MLKLTLPSNLCTSPLKYGKINQNFELIDQTFDSTWLGATPGGTIIEIDLLRFQFLAALLSPACHILPYDLPGKRNAAGAWWTDKRGRGQRRLYCAGREVGTSGLNSGNVSRNITSTVPYLSNNCAPCYYTISILKNIDSKNKNRGTPTDLNWYKRYLRCQFSAFEWSNPILLAKARRNRALCATSSQ